MPGWARWDRWAQWNRWGGGGVVTFDITGQINDASGSGLDGVTVTLTGDASDSVVTAGGGLYEFTGLNPGSYTVTPTKAGYTFDPTSAAVTIVGTDKIATTMAAVWNIAGTILDGASPIAGVTVTLTGDASDSTTTDGSGNYEFTGLSNGNYTVTPTKASYVFSPTSSAEVVTGADVSGADFAGYTSIISGSLAEYQYFDLSGQVLTDISGNAYHGQLGTTSGVDTNDPAWNASGWLEYDADDVVILPAALDTAAGTGAQTWIVVAQIDDHVTYPQLVNSSPTNNAGVAMLFDDDNEFLLGFTDNAGGADAVATSSDATPLSTWGFFAVVYDPSTRVTAWGSAANDALTEEAEDTTDIPAATTARTNTLLGNRKNYDKSCTKMAFAACIKSAISDADMQNVIYPAVQTLMAGKGISLP